MPLFIERDTKARRIDRCPSWDESCSGGSSLCVPEARPSGRRVLSRWVKPLVPALQLPPPPAEVPHRDRLSWPREQTFLDRPPSGDLEVTVDFLTEVDKLVQLIECPIFTCKGPASGLCPA